MAQCLRYRVAGQPAVREACGFHSLTVRLGSEATFDVVRERARAAADAHPATAGLSIWHERPPAARDDPTARARVQTEAGRPLHGAARPLRAVFLEYTQGPADLVLVARRSELSGNGLRDIALLLSEGRRISPPSSLAVPGATPAAGVSTFPEWGLGDPSAAGRCGEVSIPLNVPAPTDALLIAATAITAARHSSSDEPGVAVWSTAVATTDMWVYSADCNERQTVRGYLEQYRNPADGAPAGAARIPTIGMIFDECRTGEFYRPFLSPALPMVIHCQRVGDGSVSATLGYREREIAPEIARDFAAHLAHVARQLASAPDLPFGEIELMSRAEAIRLVRGCATPSDASVAANHTIHGLLAEVVRRQPDAVAVVDEKIELSYLELEQRAERLARGLVSIGAAPGSLIAVALDRTAEFVAALLGVLKAGCAYVPVDIRYPRERLRYTVEHAGAVIAIGRPESFPRSAGVRLVAPEELYDLAERESGGALPREADGSGPAYVIYTSGSTGRPKGVVIPHRNVVALVSATRVDFSLGPHDSWTFFHSCAFDFSVWEIWGCLLTGGRLVVVPYWAARDTELFYELVVRQRVTVLNQTPSAFARFDETDARLRARLAVRLVVFGGEALDVGVLAAWFARHSPTSCRMSNMFGITETTVHVTEQTLTPAEVAAGSRSVGRALPGWSLSVRDSCGRVLPAGAAGEVYVGGAGVALGYLHQPELTKERFVTDPFVGGRLYRSGDLGRIRPDGRLDHLGRIDNQVKVRGHRIELDEIRAVLSGHPAVAGAAVALRYGTPGDRDTARIDAYYVVRSGAGLLAQDLRNHAAGVLPDYMLPVTLTEIDSIPLTVNGKAHLTALPEPIRAAGSAPQPEPGRTTTDPTATAVLALWSRLLNTEVGLGDNFFELGGNSLLVVRLLRELQDTGLPRVSVRDFYRNSVAVKFIQLVREGQGRALGT